VTSCAINAGGLATRMGGRAKSFLDIGGQRIIDRQLAVLAPLFEELFIVANDAPLYAPLGLRVVGDAVAGVGPLGGILAAIEASAAPRVFVVACDMPMLSADAIRLVVDAPTGADVAVPVIDGRPEPLFARYGKGCAAAIRARLAAGERKITRFFDDVRVHVVPEAALRAVDPELRTLANCNTPEDLL
jgi:molybdopterin-guanine dinucleotide biosynthesis protein A